MKITYTQNPLNTTIELDDKEVEVLRLKIRLSEMEDMVFSAHFALTSRLKDMGSLKAYTIEQAFAEAARELDPDYWCQDGQSRLDVRVDELLAHFLAELKSSHGGDCTCYASSCSKCIAEDKLGMDTIRGLGKHSAHKIQTAFTYKDGDIWKTRTLNEALEILRAYNPTPSSSQHKADGFENLSKRWTAEAMLAYDWLLAYRDEHFSMLALSQKTGIS